MIGQVLGHYRILEKIGAGGMGEVYRAHDDRLGRDVAIKVLHVNPTEDADIRKKILREARSASALNDPRICTIHEVGEVAGNVFIVMELVEGHSLDLLIPSKGLATKLVVRYGVQIAAALAHAHDRAIVHRDIKSSNVVISQSGQVKILDFGLAVQHTGSELEDATRSAAFSNASSMIAGTLPYMSPEILRGEEANPRTDIWALGVVLYEMAEGKRPFQGKTPYSLSSAILREAPAPLPSSVPAILRHIIEHCLEKEPGQRYQHANEVRAALEAVQSAGSSIPLVSPTKNTVPRRLVGWSLGALAVIGVAGSAFLNIGDIRSRFSGHERSSKIRSIAVLPLEDLSRDPEQEYFTDGMTDELIGQLAKIGSLRVVSRTSVMRFKGTRQPLQTIARELNVDGIVEGTVLRSGNRVRITAQLIDVDTDRHLWSEAYERDLQDVIALQSEVAKSIAAEVRIKFTPQELDALSRSRAVKPESHIAYLKGLYFLDKRTEDSMKKSETYFQQAIDSDPGNALAYAGLADIYETMGSWEGGMIAPSEAFPKAKAAAERALNLDSNLSEAHAAIGYVKLHYDWDWPGAEAELKRAIELNPNSEIAHHWYSHYLLTVGRASESLAESKRGLELAPLDPLINVHLVWHYCFSRQYDLAIQQARETMEISPAIYGAPLFKGWALEQKGDFPNAIASFQRAVSLSGGVIHATSALGHAYGMAGDKSRAKGVLQQLQAMKKERYVPAYDVAMVHLGIGEREQALQWLERDFEERSAWMVYLNMDPRLDVLRSDSRFLELVRRVGLQP